MSWPMGPPSGARPWPWPKRWGIEKLGDAGDPQGQGLFAHEVAAGEPGVSAVVDVDEGEARRGFIAEEERRGDERADPAVVEDDQVGLAFHA